MKISSVSCRQFAGLRNLKPVEFSDGLNIVYGKNESGKSTLVGLINSILWQSSKVGSRSAGDKEFRAAYFPAEVKSGVKGSTVDGELVIDADDGCYTITKKWSASGSGTMETPTALLDEFADSKEYATTMKTLLVYGEGVYREAIFANQKTIGGILQALLSGKLDSDLSSVASSAIMDMGGISSEKFMDAIKVKMDELEASWDWRTDGPKGGRGIDNKIGRNVGSILKAYYALEENKRKLSTLQSKMKAVGKADKAYADAHEEYKKAEQALTEFNTYYTILVNYRKTTALKENAGKEWSRRKAIGEKWPNEAEKLKKAKELESEQNRADTIALWEELSDIQEKYNQAQKELEQLPKIAQQDLVTAKELSSKIRRLENKLKTFSAMIAFRLEDGYEIIITSEVDGRRIQIDDSVAEISEAVQIEIPGVVTFHLSAADVNVMTLTKELEDCKIQLTGILDKYSVESYEKLSELAAETAKTKNGLERECEVYNKDMVRLLKDRKFEDIQSDYEKAVLLSTRSMEEIKEGISTLTKSPIGIYVRLLEQSIDGYMKEYVSPEQNLAEIARLEKEIKKYQGEIDRADSIPEEYKRIADPEKRKSALENSAAHCSKEKNERYQDLQDARAAVKAAEEADDYMPLDELAEQIEDDAATLVQLKDEYLAWKQIKAAAEEILNEGGRNPLQTLEDDFREYLTELSGERVELSSLGKKLDAEIYSGNNRMTYELLSEGTKDTVALAFRMAVIKFLFPDGGGFVVFDDPFTDMDEERRERACKLVQEFSEKNQVIFVTCDERYLEMLSGKVINFKG